VSGQTINTILRLTKRQPDYEAALAIIADLRTVVVASDDVITGLDVLDALTEAMQ
jgi:hypothetical protein